MGMKELLAEEWQNVQQLRYLQIEFDAARCVGTWQCYEVCPVGRWIPDCEKRVVILSDARPCIACGACVLQCPEDAIRLVTR
jgi:NAD-dependent dihydropyrimidine dehydrogenase PreA subunit